MCLVIFYFYFFERTAKVVSCNGLLESYREKGKHSRNLLKCYRYGGFKLPKWILESTAY